MSLLTVVNDCRTGTLRLSVIGEIDRDNAEVLRNSITTALTSSGQRRLLLVDLADTTFIDCAGISTLLEGSRLAAGHRIGYTVINAHGVVRHVLTALRLEAVLCGTDDPALDHAYRHNEQPTPVAAG